MNGRERVQCALDRQKPDRVPVFDWMDERVVRGLAELLGFKAPPHDRAGEATRHGEESTETLELYARVVETLDLDAVWSVYSTGLRALRPDWGVDKYGRGFMLSEHGIPAVMDSPLRTLDDVAGFDMAARVRREDFCMLAFMVDRFGHERFHLHSINGPFQEGWLSRGGMDKSFLDMATNPEMAHAVGRLTTDFNIACIDIVHDLGGDGIILDGDLSGNDHMLMSKAHFCEFILPYKRRIVDHAHGLGLKVIKHSDGNMWALIDDLIGIGFDGFHPVQPQCMTLGETKAWTAGRIAVLGNVDCLDLLVNGTPGEVRAQVRQTIREGAPGGGYILCSSNSLHPGVKPENALAMFRAAKEFGDHRAIPDAFVLDRQAVDLARLARMPQRAARKRARGAAAARRVQREYRA